MRLLEPYFLYAFLALAIPILIHLFSLQRHKTVYFSNVAFLKQLQQKKRNISKLQNLILLAIRLLLLSAIILAFCQPYISDSDKNRPKDIITGIYLDNSFSMQAQNDKGQLLEIAKSKARSIIESRKDIGDFVFLDNLSQGKYQRIIDFNSCLDAIDETSITSKAVQITAVVDRWNSIKEDYKEAEAELFIISDLQKSTFSKNFYNYDSTYTTHILPINSYPQANLSIDSCFLESPTHYIGSTEWLNYSITNESNEPIENLTVKLIINKQQVALNSVSIDPYSSISSKLSYNNNQSGIQKCKLEINDAGVDFDNSMYFSYTVEASKSVLSIYDQTENNSLRYLYDSKLYNYSSKQYGHVQSQELNAYDLVILQDVEHYKSGFIQDLTSYVKNGGKLCIFPSENLNINNHNLLAEALGIHSFSAKIPNKTKISLLNPNHLLFKDVFENIDRLNNYPSVNIHYSLTEEYHPSVETILELNNKKAFTNSYQLGLGTVYLFSSPLSKKASNFQSHALIVPMLHNMVLLHEREEKLYYTIGRDFTIRPKYSEYNKQWTLSNIHGLELIPESRTIDKRTLLTVPDIIVDAGFYTLSADTNQYCIPFNFDRAESRLSTWDIENIREICEQNTHLNFWQSSGLLLEDKLKEDKFGKSLWHLFILLALLLLLIESILLKNWKQKAKQDNQ